jgi:hypothetical protein
VATTISCGVMRGGGIAPRATINGQQFIECGVLRGGGRLPNARIGSKAQVLNVKGWTPDQDDEEVAHGHSVEVNVEALNTAERDVHYDEGADFLTGAFSNMQVVGDELNLSTSPDVDDFEGYTLGQNPIGNGWTARTTATSWAVQQEVSGDSQHMRHYDHDTKVVASLDAGPNISDVETLVRIRFNDSVGQGGPCLRLTGSGSALRGYTARIGRGSTFLQFKRFTGDGTTFGISSQTFGFTPAEDEWIFIRFKMTTIWLQAKVWKEGDAEPGTWKVASDGSHSGPGVVGLFAQTDGTNRKIFFDDFSTETIPPSYASFGSWEDSVDVSSVDHYSHGLVTWDETTPTDTTAAVKCRWRSTDSWTTLTSGEIVPNIEYEQDMRAGATKDTLELRVELATTDSEATPAVSNLRVYFEPARDEEFKVTVHGVENTVAAQTLSTWGRAFLRSAAGQPYIEDPDWSDIFMLTGKQWIARDLEIVTAALTYWGNAIESITFEAEASKYRNGYARAFWSVPVTPFEHGAGTWTWTALKEWYPMGHNYAWNIIDQGMAIHADARWIVGHIQVDDNPGSFLAGLLVLDDHIGSLIAEGYRLDDNVGMALIQGWRRDDQPGSLLPAEAFFYDLPGSMIPSIREFHDQPGMFLVYGVNREGSFFVNVIDDNTYQTLIDFGVTFS